jgi:hypothetical protein
MVACHRRNADLAIRAHPLIFKRQNSLRKLIHDGKPQIAAAAR